MVAAKAMIGGTLEVKGTVERDVLVDYLNDRMSAEGYPDYGPNGLQIEGVRRISKLAFSVSATREAAETAVRLKADALIVHHGLFWTFQNPQVLTGPFSRRVFPLVRHDINLIAYHLPLDAHPEIGNAAVLAQKIGLAGLGPFGDHQGSPTGVKGHFSPGLSAKSLQKLLETTLNHPVILASPDPAQMVQTLGIITGGANKDWRRALKEGLDGYLTGEISEHDWHESQEAGIHMFAGGHHATEQFGIQALMKEVAARFSLECFFIPSGNPA